MPELVSVFPLTLGALALLFLTVWALSVLRRDASIVDVLWGVGFAFVALTAYAACPAPTWRARLVLALTLL